jgi:DNA-binding NarL/FixJ family response regulator
VLVIRVLVADDQAMIRDGFRMVINGQPDMQVVGEAANGRTAIELARRLKPDVALLDIRMPGLNGLEATRILTGEHSDAQLRVVVVTTFDLDEYVDEALRNGACGFLLKRSGPALLTEAVRAAVAGDTLISPSITVRLLRRLRATERDTPAALEHPLTAREVRVAGLVAQGMTNAEIADTLTIAPATAKAHVANIQHKLDVRNRVGIAAWAWDTGHADPRSDA